MPYDDPKVEIRPIPGWPGYTVDSNGIVYGKTGKPLSPRRKRRTGHLRVRLYGPRGRVTVAARPNSPFSDEYVHRLVCLAFHGPPPDEYELVRHLDDVPDNNSVDNLRWGSAYENVMDRMSDADKAVHFHERFAFVGKHQEYEVDDELGF